ncbi:hypothetical protein HYN43_002480 [Mucilaginibacter celer]|uniref:Histidine kinase/HSP90-like ATPase domain-containing protein n=1 Tax=Mucilaginibacter celer TaxID=2305508 RepID=A0A494VK04_9SPHI|nr:hypothetical protein HYN43_002480 [Mucilaginibacter celer]
MIISFRNHTVAEDAAPYDTLLIANNGIGMPEEFDLGGHNLLGMGLMRRLSGQIQGDLGICNGMVRPY